MLRIENLTKAYGTKFLFKHASYHFPQGQKIALIGDNGAGKSTLLNIITGLEECDAGEILIPPKISVGHLPQEPNLNPKSTILEECEAGNHTLMNLKDKMEKALAELQESHDEKAISAYETFENLYKSAGGYSITAKAGSILSGLGFQNTQLKESPLTLSGGWRMRLELAKLFIKEPDFLILDEPTNHLDLPSLVWVENYLLSFKGTLLFVSHDKTLLNKLPNITLHLDKGNLVPYKGNYDFFIYSRKIREEQEESKKIQIQKKIDSMEEFVTKFGAKATKAKQAQSRVKMIEKLEQDPLFSYNKRIEEKINFSLPLPEKSDRILFQIKQGSIGYENPLSQGINLDIEKGRKIAVIGSNGIGKSTLLKTIINKVKPIAGDFLCAPRTLSSYFAQDQLENLSPNKSIIDNILSQSQLGQKEVRQILGGFLFRGDDVFKEVKVLSGGEKSRVGLATVLCKKSNLLLLDEPTNHLDMKSTESLIDSLNNYRGTVLFVSHDRNLINKICTHVFAMLPSGRSMLFEGKLPDYEKLSEIAGFPNVLDFSDDTNKKQQEANSCDLPNPDVKDFKNLKRDKNKIEKEILVSEKNITQLKNEIAKIEEKTQAIDQSDYIRIQELAQEHKENCANLELAEDQWLTSQEKLDEIIKQLKTLGRL